ncbi:MAG: hypothetical protein BMS9Abin01_0111 [Gammaproteobacteria bacterium]|nr:MAG: hypothetical protein BMS9Abin01_0111 [Gammaproteobacteria bacterium]
MFEANELLFDDGRFPKRTGPQLNDGVFKPPSIKLRVEQILRMQGYKDLSRVRSEILTIAESMTALAERTFEPAVDFRRVHLKDLSGDVLVLESGIKLYSKAFDKYISGCHEVAVFVMTLGSPLDEIERDLVKSDKIVETVFLETAGWLGIEQLTKLFSAFLRSLLASEGLRLGRRMSPGYAFRVGRAVCDWSLEDQKPIFDLFDKRNLAVELLDSCAMSPKMSRSGLYGLFPETKFAQQPDAKSRTNRSGNARTIGSENKK